MNRKDFEKKKFLDKVFSDEKYLDMLSNDRLEKILDYYETENKIKENYLKRVSF